MTDQSSFGVSTSEIIKVDEGLGLVFGYGIVCKQGGEEYFDTQGDAIDQDGMVEAVADFMLHSRVSGDMHKQDANGHVIPDGQVVFSFPVTADIAKAFGMTIEKYGWLVAVKPSPDVLAKFKSGEYSGFSIGGARIEEEVVEA